MLDSAVWQQVRGVLDDPERLAEEYRRRIDSPNHRGEELTGMQAQVARLQQGVGRLIDGYAGGLISKEEFEPRIAKMRERIRRLEAQAEELADEERVQTDLRLIVGQMEEFGARVRAGLAEADWEVKRDVIRALVKQVEVGRDQVNVVFRVNPRPFDSSPERGMVHFCLGRERIPQLALGELGEDLAGSVCRLDLKGSPNWRWGYYWSFRTLCAWVVLPGASGQSFTCHHVQRAAVGLRR
jgi:site-specific DNA recombinase